MNLPIGGGLTFVIVFGVVDSLRSPPSALTGEDILTPYPLHTDAILRLWYLRIEFGLSSVPDRRHTEDTPNLHQRHLGVSTDLIQGWYGVSKESRESI